MLGYYRRRVLRLKEMINRLRDKPEDLDFLREIQLTLLKWILLTERNIRFRREKSSQLKARLGHDRLPKAAAAGLKAKLRFAGNRTKQLQQQLYIWKAFGDAIPFIYLDKWSLKPLLYNHRTPDVKQRPGFLDGKKGLRGELTLLTDALAHGVPAVLADLTNSIRHGDLCLLGGGIPVMIEVKSSQGKNARTERQVEALHHIQDYLQTDDGLNVRGAPRLQRVAPSTPEVNHQDYLNSLIVEAMKAGQAIGEPEPGLLYLAVTDWGLIPLERLKEIGEARVFDLNHEKANATWMSYQPFTLLIRDPEHLLAFLLGKLMLMVILDVEVLRNLAADRGWQLSILDRYGWSWMIERSTPLGPERLQFSRHFEGRIGLECISPKWILNWDEDFSRFAETQQGVFPNDRGMGGNGA
jgi:hypothetical protein